MSNSVSYQEFLEQDSRARARRRHPVLLIVIFMTVFFFLQYAWDMSRGSLIEEVVINQATVTPAAWIINSLSMEQSVVAQGNHIASPHGRLNVLNGCEGLETLFLLLAAIMAYPLSWRSRLQGLCLSFPLIFLLNQARIVVLWFVYLHDPELFGLLHGIVIPLLLVAVCLLFFITFTAKNETDTT